MEDFAWIKFVNVDEFSFLEDWIFSKMLEVEFDPKSWTESFDEFGPWFGLSWPFVSCVSWISWAFIKINERDEMKWRFKRKKNK